MLSLEFLIRAKRDRDVGAHSQLLGNGVSVRAIDNLPDAASEKRYVGASVAVIITGNRKDQASVRLTKIFSQDLIISAEQDIPVSVGRSKD